MCSDREADDRRLDLDFARFREGPGDGNSLILPVLLVLCCTWRLWQRQDRPRLIMAPV